MTNCIKYDKISYYSIEKDTNMEHTQFINKSLNTVIEQLKELQISYRIAMQDGIPNVLTRDYKPERLNLYVEKDIVVNINNG